MMRSRLLLGLLLLAAAVTTPARAESPATARASIATKGDLWVGQRVTLVVELATPGFFNSAPVFELPQIPGVILMPPSERPVIGSQTEGDTTLTTQRHELAVYSQRAGDVHIPAFPVRFESTAAFGKPVVSQRVTTTPVSYPAKLPPGAPSGIAVITSADLKFTDTWNPEPPKQTVPAGTAFTRTVTMEARDVSGMILPSIQFKPIDGLRAYPKPPVVDDHTERGELTGRRAETVTYVCEKGGTYSLPTLAMLCWNPDDKQLKRVEIPGRTFQVLAPPPPPVDETVQPAKNSSWSWKWLSATMAICVALAIVAWMAAPSIIARWHHDREQRANSEAAYFAKLKHACRTDNPRAVESALLAWLDRALPGQSSISTDLLAERAGNPELTRELEKLAASIYGREGVIKASWSGQNLLRQITAARPKIVQDSTADRWRQPTLPPLNPTS